MKKEIWKDAYGLKYYKVSNLGNIRSVTRKGAKGGLIKPHPCCGGYLCFTICENGKKSYKKVHIAVWEAFNGKVLNGYDIHHKNSDRQDNRLCNLEMLEKTEHRKKHPKGKAVRQLTKNGEFVAEYPNAMEAERQTGIYGSHIISCCLGGKYKSTGGYVWQFVA